jgi:choline dehydrogenase
LRDFSRHRRDRREKEPFAGRACLTIDTRSRRFNFPVELVTLQPEGLYCPAGRFHIDPWRPVDRAVITHAHTKAVRIGEVDGRKRAIGIELAVKDQGEGIVRARKGVILAAGSIGSPQLLQLSGIGPRTLLQSFGIPMVHELCGVGENLHDHLQIRMVWKVKGPTLNERANSLLGKAAMGLEYLLFKTGPLTMPPSQLGAFAKTDAAEPTPNIEWHVQPLSLDKFGDALHPFPAITPSVSRSIARAGSAMCSAYVRARSRYAVTSAPPDSSTRTRLMNAARPAA